MLSRQRMTAVRVPGFLKLELQAVSARLEVYQSLESRFDDRYGVDWKASLVREDVDVPIVRPMRVA
jgi:hypothetical protein